VTFCRWERKRRLNGTATHVLTASGQDSSASNTWTNRRQQSAMKHLRDSCRQCFCCAEFMASCHFYRVAQKRKPLSRLSLNRI